MVKYQAVFSNLAKIIDQVRQVAIDAGFSEDDVYNIDLAVDEACANIIEHSYGGEGLGDIECECSVESDTLTVTLVDTGCNFDPSSVPEPDLISPVNKRNEGGLGIFLMRHAMDEIHFYPCEGNGTTLVMTKRKSK